ncbi:family 16 glycosylhydrolase [Halanaerobiaceae bacterium Z-7014]|uniref:licheninase n=1 Tax=Halonatronomonas betaini TaxID=2778430 RepID=A0A931AT97_9FIRM|nr:family 16 glycosylhydrolase [Halonatronomonas betaini]MBF8437496.1 family 16 glycosylhydrolase [Halonatronomonas betaini]
MRKFLFIIYILVIILVFTGCGSASSSDILRQDNLTDEYLSEDELAEIVRDNYNNGQREAICWSEFIASNHELGLGEVISDNVVEADDSMVLVSPENNFDGGQKRTVDRIGYGSYIANLKTDYAAGSYTAFFMYQGVAEKNDEIDIEIYNDGSRRVDFVIWKDGVRTNYVQRKLDFDPTADFNEYRIDYQPDYVAFFINGELMALFTDDIPGSEMYLLANHWWPEWLEPDEEHGESRNYLKQIEKLI